MFKPSRIISYDNPSSNIFDTADVCVWLRWHPRLCVERSKSSGGFNHPMGCRILELRIAGMAKLFTTAEAALVPNTGVNERMAFLCMPIIKYCCLINSFVNPVLNHSYVRLMKSDWKLRAPTQKPCSTSLTPNCLPFNCSVGSVSQKSNQIKSFFVVGNLKLRGHFIRNHRKSLRPLGSLDALAFLVQAHGISPSIRGRFSSQGL